MSYLRCPDNGKIGYLTEHDANRALRRAETARQRAYKTRGSVKRGAGKMSGMPLLGDGVRRRECRIYECHCGLYHLTSQKTVDVSVTSDGGWGA